MNTQPQSEISASSPTKKVQWRCTVCDYIYEDNPLPADYVCPVCSAPASDFERIEV